jgi:hypothetical protein
MKLRLIFFVRLAVNYVPVTLHAYPVADSCTVFRWSNVDAMQPTGQLTQFL